MKKLIFISLIAYLFSLNAFGGDIPPAIVSAFKSGDASSLAGYFNSTIELTINNKEEIYSKNQAEVILKDFFAKNPPTGFTILHQGGKESSKYAIGNLTTRSRNYRITFLLKSVNSKVFIHQLRIENSNVESTD
jgi:hypothetical protein